MSNFLNSWYFVTAFLGLIFIFFTRKAWNEVIKKAAIEIKNRFFTFKHPGQEQQKVAKTPGRSVDEHKEFRELLKKLNVKNFNEFNELLENAVRESLSDKSKIKELEARLGAVTELWKFYMFSYLNLFLVTDSKFALLWLHHNPGKTKEMFSLSIFVSPNIPAPNLQKEAIFNALVSNNLIFKDSRDLYSVSDIGKDFLAFLGVK